MYKSLNPGIFKGLFNNGNNFQIPGQLAQPVIYINGSDPNFLLNTTGSPPSVANESLSNFKRFSDDGLTFSETSAINRAAWANNIAPPYSNIAWFGQLLTIGGGYSGGTTSTLGFMNESANCRFTVYWIFRNRVGENQGTTKMQLATGSSTGNRGVQFRIVGGANPGTRTIQMVIFNNTAGVNAVVSSPYQYESDESTGWKLFSWRVDAVGSSVGKKIGETYVDGMYANDVTVLNALSATANSTDIPMFGNRALGGLRYAAYLGEFIIFPEMHNLKMHENICNHLIKKWNIYK
jgi:hypothetical protein